MSPDSLVRIAIPRADGSSRVFVARVLSVLRLDGFTCLSYCPAFGVRGPWGSLRVPDAPGPLSPVVCEAR